jgi:hypothetical protein
VEKKEVKIKEQIINIKDLENLFSCEEVTGISDWDCTRQVEYFSEADDVFIKKITQKIIKLLT